MVFFKKRIFSLLKGFTDYHSHILPGVDDGVRTMDESLSILALYEELGVAEVWLTPHIMEDCPNTPDNLRARFAQLTEAYHQSDSCKGTLQFHLSAENMLDNLFDQRLASRDLLPYGPEGNQLLVETSYFTPPLDLHGTLRSILSAGYYPVLAHPERYVYMDNRDYDTLHALGIRFQLNLSSLAGMYGDIPQKKAKYLLKKAYYDRIGTDVHSLRTLRVLLEKKISAKALRSLNIE